MLLNSKLVTYNSNSAKLMLKNELSEIARDARPNITNDE